MKKLIILLMLIANCVSLFGGSKETKNGVTKIREEKYRKVGWTETFKPKGSTRLTTQADFGLEYYVCGTTDQYVLSLAYQYVLIAYPSILPIENVLHITTQNGNQINLNSIIVQQEGLRCTGYYPISEEQLSEICSGVSTVCYDIIISDQGNLVNDQESFKGDKFSKKISEFYQKIQKDKTGLSNGSTPIEFRKNSDIVLIFNGYKYDPFLYSEYLRVNDAEHTQELWDYYNENKERINSFFNSTILNELKEKNDKYTAEVQRQNQAIAAFFANLQSEYKRLEGEREQRLAVEKAKREQEKARMEAHWAEQREELAKVSGGSSSLTAQMNAEKARSTSRRMETSDLAQYQAMQMSDAVYGQAATNQALAQQRQYDAQINAQQRLVQQQQQSTVQQSFSGITENAVTASGSHIQIKVNGNSVVAYSASNSLIGPNWNAVVPIAYVEETSNPVAQTPSNIASTYAYQANIRDIGTVYWGTPTQRVIKDAPTGTPVNAVTQNGQGIKILVNGKDVVAYEVGLNQASDIQWKKILPSASVFATDSSLDGADFASRFKNKANLPGIGMVYF